LKPDPHHGAAEAETLHSQLWRGLNASRFTADPPPAFFLGRPLWNLVVFFAQTAQNIDIEGLTSLRCPDRAAKY
jgi:hypothetical protein